MAMTSSNDISRFEHVLYQVVDSTDIPALRLKHAILYALFPGGKRLRPKLIYLSGNLLNVDPNILDVLSVSIEFTHAYSLIHDDLPAMDNDDVRRGKPTCHKAFDEATAILAGDALQIMAIDVLLTGLPKTLPFTQVIAITQTLIHATKGMISGQSRDLFELANPTINEETLIDIHTLKTGKLISACISMVILAAAPLLPLETHALQACFKHLGLVFQMQDDGLDAFGKNDPLGKARSSDLANQKTTFATLHREQELAKLINELYQKALDELQPFGERAKPLCAFIHQLHKRTSHNEYGHSNAC